MTLGRVACAVAGALLVCLASVSALAAPVEVAREASGGFTVVARDAPVSEVFEMLSRRHGANIVLGDAVDGRVSLSLYDAEFEHALHAIAEAAGFVIERVGDTYLVVERDELGEGRIGGGTEIRSFKIQYTDPEKVREILEKHLSRHGEITALEDRKILVVEDRPEFLDRAERLLDTIDREPQQILLEARILEIALTSNDIFGIDWQAVAKWNGEMVTVGVRGMATATGPGLFFDIVTENFKGTIEALSNQGRVRTLATPRLLTLENQEAEVLIGDRLGYRVTTTINQVTTESVEFISSGVILRFKPSVDRLGRVLMEIHPEVSTGVITDGIPSVTTTEVTTQLLADDGQEIFIGGLIRDQATENRRGVPGISRVPGLQFLTSRNEWQKKSTETVVIVRSTVVKPHERTRVPPDAKEVEGLRDELDRRRKDMEDDLDVPWSRARPLEPEPKAVPEIPPVPPAVSAPTDPLLEAPQRRSR